MGAAEYLAALEALGGLSNQDAGRYLGVTIRTAQYYASRGCPEPIGRLLKFFLKHGLDLEELEHV
jgi:hypothetical protein